MSMSKFICGLQNFVSVRKQSNKDALYSGRPRSSVTISNINKIIIEKDARFTVRQLAQNDKLGLSICPLHSEENSLGYEGMCSLDTPFAHR